jgi:YD repeat-containing protein
MSRLRRARRAGTIALAAAGITCGGGGGSGSNGSSGSPTAPGGTPSGPSCRTYPTSANVHTTNSASSVVFDALEAATFDSSSRKATVNTNFANGSPCSTLVTSYNSVADFVDEVRVIPPVSLATGAVNTNSGACGAVTASTIYTYDSQRRVTQISNSAGGVITYTAWDSSGRPTTGTMSGGGTISIVYDDAARSWTETQTQSNGTRSVGTLTFDANGAQIRNVVVQGNVTTTTTFSNTATATVCK